MICVQVALGCCLERPSENAFGGVKRGTSMGEDSPPLVKRSTRLPPRKKVSVESSVSKGRIASRF